MLDGTGNTHCHVQLGGHHLARLSDLQVVGDVACVHGCARGTHCGAELVCDVCVCVCVCVCMRECVSACACVRAYIRTCVDKRETHDGGQRKRAGA